MTFKNPSPEQSRQAALHRKKIEVEAAENKLANLYAELEALELYEDE